MKNQLFNIYQGWISFYHQKEKNGKQNFEDF